jgi:hypothetical protein
MCPTNSWMAESPDGIVLDRLGRWSKLNIKKPEGFTMDHTNRKERLNGCLLNLSREG